MSSPRRSPLSRSFTGGSPLAWVVATVLVAAVAVVAALVVLPSTPTPVDSRADRPVGISFGNRLITMSDDDLDRALDDAVALHSPWIRMDLDWNEIQPAGPSDHRWERVDRVVEAARDRDLSVLGIVAYTPAWARSPGCDRFSCPPADPEAFARFAGETAEHFGDDVAAYEIWNEPNYAPFWPDPDADRYGDLLAAAAPAVRDGAPKARVLLGGLAALNPGPRALDAADFLRRACGSGRCDGVDAVAYHPYTFPRLATDAEEPTTTWQRMRPTYRAENGLATAMAESGLSDKPLWVTEFGAPTGGGDGAVSEGRQAQILLSGLRATQEDRIGGFFWYTWRDLDQYGSLEDHFGLRRLDGTPKPAYRVMRSALAP